MYKGSRVGVVVPAYNAEQHIAAVLNNLPDFVDSIYVEDARRTYNTYRVASGSASRNESLSVIKHEVNKGVGAAIVTGYKRCLEEDVDIAVVMAGDDQMSAAELPGLLAPLIEGMADYSKGNRMLNRKYLQGMTHWRRFGNWLLQWLTRIAAGNRNLMDPQNGYTAISRKTLKQMDIDAVYPWYGYCNDILVKLSVAGARIYEVAMPARYQGEISKIRYSRYIPRVSMLLLRDFLWRLKMKYVKRPSGKAGVA